MKLKWDSSEGSKPATRGVWMGADQNFFEISKPSADVPKSPQTLKPRSVRIAMDNLSQLRKLGTQRGSKSVRTNSKRSSSGTDRSDRYRRPVWPVKQFKNRQTGLTGLANRSDRWCPENPENLVPNRESRANRVQIGWNLEDSFVPTPRVYPQEISP